MLTGSLDSASAALGLGAQPAEGQFSSIPNFRDAAGDEGNGYPTADGHHMAQGLFYRSDALDEPSDADAAALDAMHIGTVYDLRSDGEVEDAEDVIPTGAVYERLPISVGEIDLAGLVDLDSPEEAREYMRDMNRSFVTEEDSRDQFAAMLTDMAETDGPFVFHCTSGKDRTGWTAVLLQHIAGVSDDTIMDDYLLTNDYIADTIGPMLDTVEAAGLDPEVFRPMITVDKTFLQAGIDQAVENFGSIDGYLTDGIGLDEDTIAALKTKLTA